MRATLPLVLLSAACSTPLEEQPIFEAGASVQTLAEGLGFTEGPVWLPTTSQLVFSDIPNGKLMVWTETDGVQLYREEANPNGNLLDAQGRLKDATAESSMPRSKQSDAGLQSTTVQGSIFKRSALRKQ